MPRTSRPNRQEPDRDRPDRPEHRFRPLAVLAFALVIPALLGTTPGSEAPAPQVRFERPAVLGGALAWCLDGERDCGAPAAVAWCQWRGFADAADFERAPAAAGATRSLGSGATCQGETCPAFRSVTCAGVPAAPSL